MRLAAPSMLLAVLAAPALAAAAPAGKAPAKGAPLATEEDKTLYALGAVAARSFKDFNLTAQQVQIVERGLTDALTPGRKLEVDPSAYEPKVQEFAVKRMEAAAGKREEEGKGYADKASKEKGAEKTASGLVVIPEKPGTGPSPKADDTVKVNYEGRLIDGTVFDASATHGGPAEFPVNRVIPCWTEALQKMKVGEKAKLVCPSSVAYGPRGAPPKIPGGATLVFNVELLEIVKPAAAPAQTPAK